MGQLAKNEVLAASLNSLDMLRGTRIGIQQRRQVLLDTLSIIDRADSDLLKLIVKAENAILFHEKEAASATSKT